MTTKHYISAQQLLEDSFKLAAQVYNDGFRPDFIIGIWRGGAPLGIAVQEYFDFKGISTDHIAVRTSSYHSIGQQSEEIKVHGLHYVVENANASHSLLIVDDVFDSGRSVVALQEKLSELMRLNLPSDIRVACSYYKPKNTKVAMTPDYFLYKSEQWLVFPHEITGLTSEEIRTGKSDLKNIHALFIDPIA